MKKQKSYDIDFKKQTVLYMVDANKSISQVAREVGISTSTLCEWSKKYHPNPQECRKDKRVVSIEQQKLRESQKRVRELEEENAILKKATAIFSNHPR